jgi:thioredoxin-like negative regulator of GroEL
VVEAATYEELVASSSEDVLFDLYAPWCILCARNKPVYEEVASRISEVSRPSHSYPHSHTTN